jgi:hypothetical protein
MDVRVERPVDYLWIKAPHAARASVVYAATLTRRAFSALRSRC